MKKTGVQKLYAIGSAKWYDPFKRIWNKLVSTGAEKDFGDFLKKNLNENTAVLELGCGTALNLEKIQKPGLPFKHYLGLDFSPDMLKIARGKFHDDARIEFREQDITRLGKNGPHGHAGPDHSPKPDHNAKYDVIISTWVLSHLQSPAEFVNAAQKLLNKNGKMFLIFFSRPKWYLRFFMMPLSRFFFFMTRYLRKEEVAKFQNVKTVKRYSADIVTAVEINQR